MGRNPPKVRNKTQQNRRDVREPAQGQGTFVSTHMRGELGAVDVTLLEYGGVSVKSFIIRIAFAMAGIGTGSEPYTSLAGGGRTARWWGCSSSGDVGEVDEGEVEGGDGGDEKSRLFMTSLASADCFASRRPASVGGGAGKQDVFRDGAQLRRKKNYDGARGEAGWRGKKQFKE